MASKKVLTREGELLGVTLRVHDSDGKLLEEWISSEEPSRTDVAPK